MAREITQKSSLEAALEEARAYGASPDDATRIHNVVEANTAHTEVRNFALHFGPDSTDDRAVWIDLIVDSDLQPSNEKIKRLNGIADKIRSELLEMPLNLWPYVAIRGRG
jgi:hypothetical protein